MDDAWSQQSTPRKVADETEQRAVAAEREKFNLEVVLSQKRGSLATLGLQGYLGIIRRS